MILYLIGLTFTLIGCSTTYQQQPITYIELPSWIPFDYGLSYSGIPLPDAIYEGDRLLARGKYEASYLKYNLVQRIPTQLKKDLTHRKAVILILLKQPSRALELMEAPRNRELFNNPEGAIIRIKALFDGKRKQRALEEAERILRSKISLKIQRKLEMILLEQQRLGYIQFDRDLERNSKLGAFLNKSLPSKPQEQISDPSIRPPYAQSLTICALLPLSGSAANIGSKIAQGVSVAYEKHLESAPKFFIKDVGSTASDFETNFNTLSQETKCDVFLGPFILEQAKIFQSLNRNKAFTVYLTRKDPGGDFPYLHLGLTLRSQALGVQNYLAKNLFSKVIIVRNASQLSQEISEEFVKIIKIPSVEYSLSDLSQTSIANLEKEIIRAKFDVVLATLTVSEIAELIMGLSDKAKSLVQIVGTSILDDKTTLTQVANLMENVVYPTFLNRQSPSVADFINTFRSKNLDSSIDIFSALGFETAELLIQAYQRFGYLDQRAVSEIARQRNGLMGPYSLQFLPSLERTLDVIHVKDKLSQ